jgi:hypothetical protein
LAVGCSPTVGKPFPYFVVAAKKAVIVDPLRLICNHASRLIAAELGGFVNPGAHQDSIRK